MFLLLVFSLICNEHVRFELGLLSHPFFHSLLILCYYLLCTSCWWPLLCSANLLFWADSLHSCCMGSLFFCSAVLNISIAMVFLQCTIWFLHGWCHVKLLSVAISTHFLLTPYIHAPVYSVVSCKAWHVRYMHFRCYLRFWQNDLDLFHDTATEEQIRK